MLKWEKDIKQHASEFCVTEIVAIHKRTGAVEWKSPTGTRRVAWFERSGDRWLVMNLE